jgi:hypothetical protein
MNNHAKLKEIADKLWRAKAAISVCAEALYKGETELEITSSITLTGAKEALDECNDALTTIAMRAPRPTPPPKRKAKPALTMVTPTSIHVLNIVAPDKAGF